MYEGRKRKNGVAMGLCVAATGPGLAWLFVILATLPWNGLGGLDLAVFMQMTPPPNVKGGGPLNAIAGSLVLTVIFSRAKFLHFVWGTAAEIHERTVDVHVGRLRKALVRSREQDPIRTVRGAGCAFDETLGKALKNRRDCVRDRTSACDCRPSQ